MVPLLGILVYMCEIYNEVIFSNRDFFNVVVEVFKNVVKPYFNLIGLFRRSGQTYVFFVNRIVLG